MRSCTVSDDKPETPSTSRSSEAVDAAALDSAASPATPDETPAEEQSATGPIVAESEVAGEVAADGAGPASDESAASGDSPVEAADYAGAEAGPSATQPVVPVEPAAVQTVYVHAPVPPHKKGNRGIGSLIALGSAVVFAAVYAAVVLAVVPLFAPPRAVGFEFMGFIGSQVFFVPVLVFAVGFILLVLILNRASWWAYIVGSLFVGLFVYFVGIGILLLLSGVVGLTPSAAAKVFLTATQSPILITAGLVAREVSLWMGVVVAARGRRIKARNAEARAGYDRDTARARAEYERAVAANAAG